MLASVLRIAALLLICIVAFEAAAQDVPDWARSSDGPTTRSYDNGGSNVPCPPGQNNSGPGGACQGDAPEQTPIDGGLSLLALAGGAYAVRRLRKKGDGAEETVE